MIRKIVFIVLLAFAAYASADDNDRLDVLEKEMVEVKARLSKLEAVLNKPSDTTKTTLSGDGWKHLANWRKLSTDMTPSDVRRILGEPHRLNGGTIARWHYKNGGEVMFYRDKIERWREPLR